MVRCRRVFSHAPCATPARPRPCRRTNGRQISWPPCLNNTIPGSFSSFLFPLFSFLFFLNLLSPAPDYVIDCIDDVETKADLLQACQARNIAVLSALGAGGKSDPTRVLIGEMADPVKDPLAMKLRKTLYWRAEARAKRAAEAADEAATTAAGGSKPEGAVDGCTSATSTKGKEKGRSTGRSVKGADPAVRSVLEVSFST